MIPNHKPGERIDRVFNLPEAIVLARVRGYPVSLHSNPNLGKMNQSIVVWDDKDLGIHFGRILEIVPRNEVGIRKEYK